jgi:hypothetical protein
MRGGRPAYHVHGAEVHVVMYNDELKVSDELLCRSRLVAIREVREDVRQREGREFARFEHLLQSDTHRPYKLQKCDTL